MQKDIHFYVTYALAVKAGLTRPRATKIAWADYRTDEVTQAACYGIQTQLRIDPLFGNWKDRQVQLSVLIPFHFIPGEDPKHRWKTTANSKNASLLVAAAKKHLLQTGIALHVLQDTFSHQGFSGWQEPLNSCYPWYYPVSALPNIGHAEMRAAPDIACHVWTDPRTNQVVDNSIRAMAAAEATYAHLTSLVAPNVTPTPWDKIEPGLREIFHCADYDKRKDQLRKLAASPTIRYSTVDKKATKKQKCAFAQAARAHLAAAMAILRPLPCWP